MTRRLFKLLCTVYFPNDRVFKKFISSTNFINNYNVEFHENPTNGSVADINSQVGRQRIWRTDGRDLRIKLSLRLFLRKV